MVHRRADRPAAGISVRYVPVLAIVSDVVDVLVRIRAKRRADFDGIVAIAVELRVPRPVLPSLRLDRVVRGLRPNFP